MKRGGRSYAQSTCVRIHVQRPVGKRASMSLMTELVKGEPLYIVTSTLGDKIAAGAERIRSLAFIARHTEHMDPMDWARSDLVDSLPTLPISF